LTTYTTLKYTEEKYSKLSKIGFLASRFIHLTPQLAIFILLTTLMPLMGSGPVWSQQILLNSIIFIIIGGRTYFICRIF
jgi:hypothetical protein